VGRWTGAFTIQKSQEKLTITTASTVDQSGLTSNSPGQEASLLAYLAGIVDGEAYIGIKHSNHFSKTLHKKQDLYHERLQVRMKESVAVRLLAATFGGPLSIEKMHSRYSDGDFYCYNITDKRAAIALKTLFPYLRVKKKQAGVVIALRKLKDARTWPSSVPMANAHVLQRRKLYDLCRSLNGGGYNNGG
jgi:hypothetical protein